MGTIVAAACLSHSPGITGFPDQASPHQRDAVHSGLAKVSTEMHQARLDALIVVTAEHFTNFFLSNLPTFAVGTAKWYEMPATDRFARFLRIARRRYPGHVSLGEVLYQGLLERDFDPALVAGGYGFDEGMAVPLAVLDSAKASKDVAGGGSAHGSAHGVAPAVTAIGAADPDAQQLVSGSVPVVPVIVNAVHAPYPSMRRCYRLGEAIGQIVAEQDVADRVAVIGSGGLSHWVGLPQAGTIDQELDKQVLRALSEGKGEALCELTDSRIDDAGNGAHEIRAWAVAAGMVGCVPFETLAYEAVPTWLTGTAVARARLESLSNLATASWSRR